MFPDNAVRAASSTIDAGEERLDALYAVLWSTDDGIRVEADGLHTT
ncbi:hypothetical protein HQ325_04160 [Rhodococcus sp. BP-349]|nr:MULTISPECIES: hypothetical protein [unclassified Rhodococcus (in: high G+C Gram-positive bacteria)]MBY6537858.1 hypothetical protein [Rhodococcus sp. BP-363]MBY6542195.1 hypothetical protein [Rhodococcus sp. BP-369]MBY6561425.1 hypothetical protein [Rhodococcus sp. BP-370]MBY6575717.1 hypothetical protein [Rhodococcus sp. BP-364]MBY6585018.1 hypothetical protein [Rhodococcus sp. BP-358]